MLERFQLHKVPFYMYFPTLRMTLTVVSFSNPPLLFCLQVSSQNCVIFRLLLLQLSLYRFLYHYLRIWKRNLSQGHSLGPFILEEVHIIANAISCY